MRDKEPTFEGEVSPEKQELLELEKTGQYLFHGSGKDLDTLDPRQAMDVEKGPDGEPAVFAASAIDYAIFMAIINNENCPEGSWTHAGATINDDDKSFELKFGATQHSLDQITEKSSGYVYVFDKKDFVQRKEGGVEYVSHNSVKPILKIRVSKQDLPQNIEVTPEDK